MNDKQYRMIDKSILKDTYKQENKNCKENDFNGIVFENVGCNNFLLVGIKKTNIYSIKPNFFFYNKKLVK